MTAGRGSRDWWSELSTTASPGARPAGTSTTSPGSSRLRESSVSGLPGPGTAPGGVVLGIGQGPPQPRVLGEVAQVAGHGLAEAGEGFFPAPDLPGQSDDGAVRLELGEGGFEDLAGAGPAELGQQVDGHVVRGPEAGVQRVGPPRGEAGDGGRVRAGLPQHDGVAFDVDPAAAGPAGQLGVLPRGDVHVRLAVELVQLLQHDAAGRHVDAERQGFGGEHGLDQPVDEELLHDLLEGGQHAGVVRGQSAEQAVPPAPEAQDVQVVGGDVLGGLVDPLGDDELFLLGGQPQPGRDALGHGGVAAGAGEDEGDRRQEVLPVQAGDDLRAAGLPDRAARAALRGVVAAGWRCCRRWLRPPWPKRPRKFIWLSARAMDSSSGLTSKPAAR